MNFTFIPQPEEPGHHTPPAPPALARLLLAGESTPDRRTARRKRRVFRSMVGSHWRALGGVPRLVRRERLAAARAAFNQAAPGRPAWLGITRLPARWRSAGVLFADLAAAIAADAGHALHSPAHFDLEVSLIHRFAEHRAGRRRRRRLCDCLLAAERVSP